MSRLAALAVLATLTAAPALAQPAPPPPGAAPPPPGHHMRRPPPPPHHPPPPRHHHRREAARGPGMHAPPGRGAPRDDVNRAYMGGGMVLEGPPGGPPPMPQPMPPGQRPGNMPPMR